MKTEKYIIMAQDTEKGKKYPEYPVSSDNGIIGFGTVKDAEAAIKRLNKPSPWAQQFEIASTYRIAPVVFYSADAKTENIDDALMDMIVDDLRKQGR